MYRAAVAVLAGAVLGFVVLLTTSTGLRTVRGGRIGGDFPAFYSAGRLIAAGHAASLYDPAAQEAAQADLFPPGTAGRLPFPYPPFVALAYAPLVRLPFKTAYAVHVALMTICLAWAIALAGRVVPVVRAQFAVALAVALAFYPIFRATLGGQNTPLSLLCATGAAVAVAGGEAFTAGVWSGIWLFKPQLALPLAVALLFRVGDRRRFLLGISSVAAIYYAAGAVVGGWVWPRWWWQQGAVPFAMADATVDRANAISIPSLVSSPALQPLAWGAAAVILALVVVLAWQRRLPIFSLTAFTAAAAVLVAPHALYYDGGLAILGVAVAAGGRGSMRIAAGALWALAWLQPVRALAPIPPVTVVVALSMVLAATAGRRDSGAPALHSISG